MPGRHETIPLFTHAAVAIQLPTRDAREHCRDSAAPSADPSATDYSPQTRGRVTSCRGASFSAETALSEQQCLAEPPTATTAADHKGDIQHVQRPGPEFRVYPTRFDTFRAREGINVRQWELESSATPDEMLAWRKGGDIETGKLAKVVRAARRITGKPVRASDLFDLGETTSVPPSPPPEFKPVRPLRFSRKSYDTRADRLFRTAGISTEYLHLKSRVSRPTIKKVRRALPVRASVIRKINIVLIETLCRPVRAQEFCDVGDDHALDVHAQP